LDNEEAKLTADIVEISSCKKSLVVEVPSTEVDQEVDKMARQYARTAKIPGFRPGKVPLDIV
jgi:trigger factor